MLLYRGFAFGIVELDSPGSEAHKILCSRFEFSEFALRCNSNP